MPGRHLLSEPAQCFILSGSDSRYQRSAFNYSTRYAWSLWSIQNGAITIQSRHGTQRIIAPAVILLQPGDGNVLSMPAATDYRRVSFTVVHTPRTFNDSDHAACSVSASTCFQPNAEAWFGFPLPTLIDEPFRSAAMSVLEAATRDWWRGDLRRLRASHRLGVWLFDLAISCDPLHNGTPLNEWEILARERISHGLNVSGLAQALRLDRSTLFRQFRKNGLPSPQRWLDGLRLDIARRALAQDTPVSDVAHACGFRNASAFARWFRSHEGVSPRHRSK